MHARLLVSWSRYPLVSKLGSAATRTTRDRLPHLLRNGCGCEDSDRLLSIGSGRHIFFAVLALRAKGRRENAAGSTLNMTLEHSARGRIESGGQQHVRVVVPMTHGWLW